MRRYAGWLFGVASALNLLVAAGLLFLRPWIAPWLGLDPIAGTNLVLDELTPVRGAQVEQQAELHCD